MQHQGALAYQQTTKTVETPREREAALLMKSAAVLQRARDEAPQGPSDELDGALLFNRKIWSIFLISATRDDNPLPVPVRQNIANLGLFVMNETRELSQAPSASKLDALININRQIAAGLRGA